MQINELCAVCVMTEESLKRYPACALVPFPADLKGGIFNFRIIIVDNFYIALFSN